MKHNLLIFLAILLSIPVGAVSYRKTTDGVVVTLSSKSDTTARMVRLQVVDSKIIRVTAVPGRKFPKEKSLVVLPEAYKKTPFTVEESDGRLRCEQWSIWRPVKSRLPILAERCVCRNVVVEGKNSNR